jgi:hypothetical protein
MSNVPPRHPVGIANEVLREKGINRLRFASAEELLGHGAVLIDETGREPLAAARLLLTAQATRALHTFEAVIADCQMGRGVQAAMLNRSLFDDVLNIHWVAENPELGPERADQHDRLIALAEHQLETKFERTDRPLTDEEQSELEALIKLYGGPRNAFKETWHRASFEECFPLVKERWKEEEEAAFYLEYIYEVIQRRNNLFIHPSPTAFRQTIVTRPDGGRTVNRAGPDGFWKQALNQGAGGYYMVCRVLAQEFDFDKEPMAEVFSRTTDYLKPIENEPEVLEPSDDADCPCGSGRVVSECHRS